MGPKKPTGKKPAEEKPEKDTKTLEHSKELIKAFAPIRFFLVIIGQMPFDIKKKKDNTFSFKLNFQSKSLYIFLFFFLINTASFVLVTTGIVTFMLNQLFRDIISPTARIIVKDEETLENEAQLWERYYTRREMVSVLVVWSWMTIAFSGSLYIIRYGKYYVHYINYFNRVVQLIDMDMTPGIKQYLWRHNLISIGTAGGLVVGLGMQALGFNAIGNTANVIANFILRNFGIEMYLLDTSGFYGCQLLGFLIMILALVGSRANMIQFLFFSQLLKNGVKIWNERFTKALENDQEAVVKDDDGEADQFSRRLALRSVLKDHLILVQLFQLTEDSFSTILLTYYCFQIISVVMEIYQLAALGGFITVVDDDELPVGITTTTERSKGEYEVDPKQEFELLSTALVCIVLLFQNVWFAINATVDAAGAYEQAMEGFQILRRHGFMYCKNQADRNFVLSMFISFSKSNPMQLTAGGYFAINKALLVSMAATIINWAVSIYQTKIDQWK